MPEGIEANRPSINIYYRTVVLSLAVHTLHGRTPAMGWHPYGKVKGFILEIFRGSRNCHDSSRLHHYVLPDYRKWFGYMPAIFVFYLGLPLVFAIFAIRLRFDGWKLLVVAIVAGVVLELTLFHNMMLITFPIMVIAIPALVAIYGVIAFLPKWIAEGKLMENRGKAWVLVIAWLIIIAITFMNNYR